ncbi:MAG TPA: DUF3987 domain-containing protein [Casimicrobiaceae bacterium]|jgi:putative DNA primase/helicase
MIDVQQQFANALARRGIVPPDSLAADGSLHRCDVDGGRGKGDAAYILHLNGVPTGGFQNWRDGLGWEPWTAKLDRALAPDEVLAQRELIAEAKRKAAIDAEQRRIQAREKATTIWARSQPAQADHPYLVAKGVKAHGLRLHGSALVVPVRDGAELHSLQFIEGDSSKRFLTGGQVRGHYFSIGVASGVVAVAEGFATAATIHEATGHAVAVAFDCGNLEPAARAMRAKFPDARLVICADDDHKTDGNPGLAKAAEAARAVGGLLAVPSFGDDRPDNATDFNDLHRLRGRAAVEASICNARAPDVPTPQPTGNNAAAAILGADDWPEPQMLTHDDAAQPYPLAELPESMRAAIEEVQTFTQAPPALVASSALSAASVAAQGLANIQRDEGLTGPIGLWFLTIAESGERKSTADGHFAGPLRDYERDAAETAKPAIAKHLAAVGAWEAKLAGLREAIKQGAKQGQPTQDDEARLAVMQAERPGRLQVPRLLYTDATPESLAHGMAGWPSAAVISAEAGAVLGSHAMGRDSIVRNLALLNSLWDAGALSVDRRTSESYRINGARLTISLQAQAAAVRDFFDKAGTLARGVGFVARFLVAHPESTQGTRQYRQAPQSWPALATFNSRVRALLAMPPPINERGELEPTTLILSAEAKATWVRFYNDVEGELATGGDLTDVRDVASKSADNAARLSALFHVFERGPSGAVQGDSMAKACRVVAWHLTEARRFLGEFSLPPTLANAARLDAWLLEYCQLAGVQRVARRTIQQKGPNATRDGKKLDEALADLVEAGRVQEVRDRSRREVAINPKLLGGQP